MGLKGLGLIQNKDLQWVGSEKNQWTFNAHTVRGYTDNDHDDDNTDDNHDHKNDSYTATGAAPGASII